MELINRLMTHYEQHPPRLSYGGNEGKNLTAISYQKWPTEEELNSLGIAAVKVWQEKYSPTTDKFPVEGYCVMDACLDESGRLTPDAFPLSPEMEGHELCVYVDMLGRIHMRAIGGFTSFKTRPATRSA